LPYLGNDFYLGKELDSNSIEARSRDINPKKNPAFQQDFTLSLFLFIVN